MVVVNEFRGIVTRGELVPGELRDGVNAYPTRSGVRSLRQGVRIGTAITGAEVKGAFEHRKDDGTNTVLIVSDRDLRTEDDTLVLSNVFAAAYAPGFCNGFDKTYIAGDADSYVYFSSSDCRSLVAAAPSGSISGTETGASAATGFGTGTFEYSFTDYDPTTGWESIPKAAISVAKTADADTGVKFTTAPSGSFVSPYTRIRLYRRLRGTNQWYLIATLQSSDFPYQDVTIETDLLAENLSNAHDNETGLIDMVDPGAQVHCAFYRGRLFLASGDIVRWSRVGLPFSFKSSGIAQKEIGDEGDPIQKLVVWGESLVVFKQFSIWVLNGDIDEQGFTFFPASRDIGAMHKGLVCSTPHGIFFLDSGGRFRLFDLSPDSLQWYNDDLGYSESTSTPNSASSVYDPSTDSVQFFGPGAPLYHTQEIRSVFNNNGYLAGYWMFSFVSKSFISITSVKYPLWWYEETYSGKRSAAYIAVYGSSLYRMVHNRVTASYFTLLAGSHSTTRIYEAASVTNSRIVGSPILFYDASTDTFYVREISAVGVGYVDISEALPATPVAGDIVVYDWCFVALVIGPHEEGIPLQKRVDRFHFVLGGGTAYTKFSSIYDDNLLSSALSGLSYINVYDKRRFALRRATRGVQVGCCVVAWVMGDPFELRQVHYESKPVRGSNLV